MWWKCASLFSPKLSLFSTLSLLMSRKSFGGSAGGGRKGSGVTYVKGDPAFLRRMKEAVGYREPQADLDAKRADLAQAAAAAAAGADDGAEERDDERPVVVALRQGDLTPEEARREWDREKEREREQDGEGRNTREHRALQLSFSLHQCFFVLSRRRSSGRWQNSL